jgi:tRNA-2-methylthio-N6-dimethylallyladenosine synthase
MERLARLHERQRSIQERRNRRWIGREIEVLVEGRSKRNALEWSGKSPHARIVNFAGSSAPGRLESLEIVRSTAYSLRGVPMVERLTHGERGMYIAGAAQQPNARRAAGET